MVQAQGTPSTTVTGGVPIYDAEGSEIARVTVLEVIDPFEDWSEYMAPQVGERYVVVFVQIENTGERPFNFASYDFSLLDSVGRLYTGGFPFRSDAATVQTPDLTDGSMLPGETVVGALNYTVVADAQPANVVFQYRPEDPNMYSYQHLYLLKDLTPQ